MIIYLIVFIISILCIYVGNLENFKNKITSKIMIGLGILLPCLLAANRGLTIGTDNDGYPLLLYNLSNNSKSIISFIKDAGNMYDISDFGFLVIVHISAIIFHNFKILLFLIELLVIYPVYKSISINCKNKNDIVIGMIIFFLFIYNVSLNMMRQSIALALFSLGLTYLLKNKKIPSLILLLVAISFHFTTIIGLMIYFGYLIYTKVAKGKYKENMFNYIYIATILVILNYKWIIILLYKTGIYEHGILYLQNFSNLDFSFLDTFTYIFFTVILISNKKEIKGNFEFYKFLMIEALLVLQFGVFVQYLERMSLYFLYPVLINKMPLINGGKSISKINKSTILLIMFLISYWIFVFAVLGLHDTIPYRFA